MENNEKSGITMSVLNSFDDLNSELSQFNDIVTDGEDDEVVFDKSVYRKHSKKISLTVGYLLGVKQEFLSQIEEDAEKFNEVYQALVKNQAATAIRSLNNIRSNLMLHFKEVSRLIRVTAANYTPIYQIEYLKDDFKILSRLEINIGTGRSDINEYLKIINTEISRRIDLTKVLFPDWLDFRHVKVMFDMPSNIEEESKKFQCNQNCYPYKRYFNWIYPEEQGNILITDRKLLEVIYYNDGDVFMDENRVVDVSDHVKKSISDFIRNGKKIQIFIDGENVDPYSFANAIYDLQDHEIQKIDKIVVYYDEKYSSRAWTMLKHFTFDIEVEAIPVSRIMDDKSLVDHKLVVGISKAFYSEDVDSFILASSDSDFWAVMEDVEANYLLMVEKDKCGYDFKEILRKNNIFYCYIDKFQVPEDDKFFKTVFCREFENLIEEKFDLGNAKKLLSEALFQSRADVSDGVFESLFNKYIKNMRLTVDREYNFKIEFPNP